MNNFEFNFKLIAKKYSNKIALIDIDDAKFTYKKLDYLSDNIANFLKNILRLTRILNNQCMCKCQCGNECSKRMNHSCCFLMCCSMFHRI